MEVCNLSTPAQYFHLLRRQMNRDFRKPLVLMSPKSLLRHPLAVSLLDELTEGHFQPVLDAPPVAAALAAAGESQGKPREPGGNGRGAERLVLCSGKIYYDLWERRQETDAFDTRIIRIEQLYPFPLESLQAVLNKYQGAKEVLWTQEEPENRGALRYFRDRFVKAFPDRRISLISRPASASPAVGSHRQHIAEQRELVDRALGLGSGAGQAHKRRPTAKAGKRGKA